MKKFGRNPLVTVVVAAYNEEKHIEECLRSIKIQTYPNIELLMIDDGSTDKTKNISRKYADKLLSQIHSGPGVARNKGAKNARGKILVFIDGDMYLDKKYIEKLVQPIIADKSVATFTNEEYVANPENIWVRCGNIDNSIPQGLRIKGKSRYSCVARAIKKDFFLKNGGMRLEKGYRDDHILSGANKALAAKGAVCYHYNPDNLCDVFQSAKWIGRNPLISETKYSLIRYSLLNSCINAIRRIIQGAPRMFLIYKIVFDAGVFFGVLFNNKKHNFAK